MSFPNGNRARLVRAGATDEAAELVRALGLEQPKALIVLFGGAASLEEGLKPRLAAFFTQGIARLAASIGATVFDGGTHMGVMRLMGQGLAECSRKTSLVGVAPAEKVTYPGSAGEKRDENRVPLDPNHTHFVLVEGDRWGVETGMLFHLVRALSDPEGFARSHPGSAVREGLSAPRVPVVAILVGGGVQGIARQEILESVRSGWPVLVLEGSGGLADELSRHRRAPHAANQDLELATLIQEGNLDFFSLNDPVARFRQSVLQQLGNGEILEQYGNIGLLLWAWERYELYSQRARKHQRRFYQIQFLLILLGVLTTALVIVYALLSRADPPGPAGSPLLSGLRYLIIALPILTSTLFAIANRANDGSKWILLRNSAEAIKREIYRYRTQPRKPPESGRRELSKRNARLAQCVESVSHDLMQTDANLSSLDAFEGEIPPKRLPAGDDGLSFLTPERYLEIRLDDQLAYYADRTSRKEKELYRVQLAILLAGGLGTFLAAIGLELWVALTTALATAGATFLQYRQTETTLIHFNQTATNLSNVKGWWLALPVEARQERENIEKLVDYTEKILESEHTGWMQNMQEALAGLRKDQAGEEGDW